MVCVVLTCAVRAVHGSHTWYQPNYTVTHSQIMQLLQVCMQVQYTLVHLRLDNSASLLQRDWWHNHCVQHTSRHLKDIQYLRKATVQFACLPLQFVGCTGGRLPCFAFAALLKH